MPIRSRLIQSLVSLFHAAVVFFHDLSKLIVFEACLMGSGGAIA
jgi:hypothetical protein